MRRLTCLIPLLGMTLSSFADLVVIDKEEGRHLVAYSEDSLFLKIKTCVVVSREMPARECRGVELHPLPLPVWIRNFTSKALPNFRGQRAPTNEWMAAEIDTLTIGLENNEVVDKTRVINRIAHLRIAQHRLIFVNHVRQSIKETEPYRAETEDLNQLLKASLMDSKTPVNNSTLTQPYISTYGDPGKALLEVNCPMQALIRINGKLTKSTGTQRGFALPLPPAQQDKAQYDIEVELPDKYGTTHFLIPEGGDSSLGTMVTYILENKGEHHPVEVLEPLNFRGEK